MGGRRGAACKPPTHGRRAVSLRHFEPAGRPPAKGPHKSLMINFSPTTAHAWSARVDISVYRDRPRSVVSPPRLDRPRTAVVWQTGSARPSNGRAPRTSATGHRARVWSSRFGRRTLPWRGRPLLAAVRRRVRPSAERSSTELACLKCAYKWTDHGDAGTSSYSRDADPRRSLFGVRVRGTSTSYRPRWAGRSAGRLAWDMPRGYCMRHLQHQVHTLIKRPILHCSIPHIYIYLYLYIYICDKVSTSARMHNIRGLTIGADVKVCISCGRWTASAGNKKDNSLENILTLYNI